MNGDTTNAKLTTKERLRIGLILVFALLLVLAAIFWVWQTFLDKTAWLRLLIIFILNMDAWILNPILKEDIAVGISILLTLFLAWYLGGIQISNVLKYLLEKRVGKKYFFPVRYLGDEYPGRNAIGFVTNIYFMRFQVHYNIFFILGVPHCTLIEISEDKVERIKISIWDLALAYITGGAIYTPPKNNT